MERERAVPEGTAWDPEDGSTLPRTWTNRRAEGMRVRPEALNALRSYFPIDRTDPVKSITLELTALQSACQFRASFLITPEGRDPFFVHGEVTAIADDPERENRSKRLRLEYTELEDELLRYLVSASRRRTDGLSVWIPIGIIQHGSIIVYNRQEPVLHPGSGRMVVESDEDQDEPDPCPILSLYVVEGGTVRFAYDV